VNRLCNRLLNANHLLGCYLVKSGSTLFLFLPLHDANLWCCSMLPLCYFCRSVMPLVFLPLCIAARISAAMCCCLYFCSSVLCKIHSSVEICEQRHALTIWVTSSEVGLKC
jgi:hypothetical protein